MRRVIIALLILSAQIFGVPTRFAFDQVPSRFHSRMLTTGARALGETCYSRGRMPDGTACSAAGLSQVEESSLVAQLFIGNGYAAVNTVDKFIFKPVSRDFLKELFEKKNQTSLEGQGGLAFTSPYFGAAFSPYRVQYVSEVHNPNFPVIALHASLERSLSFSGRLPLSKLDEDLDGLSFGTRVRLIERKYVHSSFSLFEAMNEEPRSLLPVREQKGAFIEPSVAWQLPTEWKTYLSAEVKNLGTVWPKDTLHDDPTDLGVGGGVGIPLSYGTLRLGLDLVNLFTARTLLSRPRLGISYQIGVLEWMAGVHKNLMSTGLQFSFQVVQVGIVYELVRSDFVETTPGSRIATEFAIRL
jgi:hypothetical protein